MLIGPAIHSHGRRLDVKRRLRWLLVVMAIANVALWSVIFGL
jgi:hypothetical protein